MQHTMSALRLVLTFFLLIGLSTLTAEPRRSHNSSCNSSCKSSHGKHHNSRPESYESRHCGPRPSRSSFSISFGGGDLFSGIGLFGGCGLGEQVVFSSRIGSRVSVLPMGCSTQYIDGNIYYVRNGTYFRRIRGGYIVVRRPCANLIIPARIKTIPSARQTVTVWIRNRNGSRTPVEITLATNGQWVGPKGEYYEDFPAETQLKSIYGLDGEAHSDTITQAPKTHILWITNRNGSKTPVELKQLGNGTWSGPKGEIYKRVPTERELRAVYGLESE